MRNLKYTPLVAQLACCLWLTSVNASSVVADISPARLDNATSTNTAPPQSGATTAPKAVELPDKLNVITGSLDNDQDVKYYSFVAVRGQKVLINQLNNPSTGFPWTFEYKLDNDWLTVPPGQSFITNELQPGQTVQARVAKHPIHPVTADAKFIFEFGSAPYMERHHLSGDATELKFYGAVTKAYKIILWHGLINDSTGHPVEGATVMLGLNKGQGSRPATDLYRVTTNNTGGFSSRIDLGKCSGTVTSPPFPIMNGNNKNKWIITYNLGYWYMYPRGNASSGIGGEKDNKVSLAHVCKQMMTS